MIAVLRMRWDPATRDYVIRRTKDGLSKREIIRCLKRYIARQAYHAITADLAAPATRDDTPKLASVSSEPVELIALDEPAESLISARRIGEPTFAHVQGIADAMTAALSRGVDLVIPKQLYAGLREVLPPELSQWIKSALTGSLPTRLILRRSDPLTIYRTIAGDKLVSRVRSNSSAQTHARYVVVVGRTSSTTVLLRLASARLNHRT
jgi:hypothetical protein